MLLSITSGTDANLIEDVEGSRLEEQEGKNEGKSKQRPLAPTQLRQGLLPDLSKGNSHFQACKETRYLCNLACGRIPTTQVGASCSL